MLVSRRVCIASFNIYLTARAIIVVRNRKYSWPLTHLVFYYSFDTHAVLYVTYIYIFYYLTLFSPVNPLHAFTVSSEPYRSGFYIYPDFIYLQIRSLQFFIFTYLNASTIINFIFRK